MKLTEWYPARVKPVRAGMYQRDWSDVGYLTEADWLDFWDGKCWFLGHVVGSPRALKARTPRRWRGLAEEQTSTTKWPFNSKMQNVAKGGR